MISFILGIICGFALAIFLLLIYVLVKVSSQDSRLEENWSDNKNPAERSEN